MNFIIIIIGGSQGFLIDPSMMPRGASLSDGCTPYIFVSISVGGSHTGVGPSLPNISQS